MIFHLQNISSIYVHSDLNLSQQPIQDWRNRKLLDHVTDLIALYDKNINNLKIR
jgi:hypothetical protein